MTLASRWEQFRVIWSEFAEMVAIGRALENGDITVDAARAGIIRVGDRGESSAVTVEPRHSQDDDRELAGV